VTFQYSVGTRFFIPENARRCEFAPIDGESLYSLSQKYNICMEDILDASNLSMYSKDFKERFLAIPLDGVHCYDETGQRLNVPEESVYKPEDGESFLDVAREHNICIDGLWDSNPIMTRWDGASYRMPEVIFIPKVKTCKFTMTLTTQSNATLLGLAVLTNICRNRIEDTNPHLGVSENSYGLGFNEKIAVGQTVTLPDRPPCYQLISQEYIEQIRYACYAVPVEPESDFTGHVPPVTASLEEALPNCYEITDGMTLFYDNAPYTLYEQRGSDIVYSECTGIELNTLSRVNESLPVPFISARGSILVPQPHTDCNIAEYRNTFLKRRQEQAYKAGYLIDGVYNVNYQETLSSIGRKFGYLSQWIADANGLSAPYTIYYLQELKLPSYPSLYTLGSAAGVIVLASSAIYGVRRWFRRRTQGKKKNI
jgi:LysM repeat protein